MPREGQRAAVRRGGRPNGHSWCGHSAVPRCCASARGVSIVLIRCACGDSLSNFRCCESPVRTRVSLYVRVLRGPVVHGGTGGKERSGAELQNDGETTEELFSWARYRCHQDSGKCLCHMSQGSWQMSRHDMTSPNPNPWQMSRHVAMSPHFILVGVKIPIKFAPSRFCRQVRSDMPLWWHRARGKIGREP